jgi:hypothetical protein
MSALAALPLCMETLWKIPLTSLPYRDYDVATLPNALSDASRAPALRGMPTYPLSL